MKIFKTLAAGCAAVNCASLLTSCACCHKHAKKAPAAPVAAAPTTPAPAPAVPAAPPTKDQRLAALLLKYQTDQITPEEYHTQRAALIAEP